MLDFLNPFFPFPLEGIQIYTSLIPGEGSGFGEIVSFFFFFGTDLV